MHVLQSSCLGGWKAKCLSLAFMLNSFRCTPRRWGQCGAPPLALRVRLADGTPVVGVNLDLYSDADRFKEWLANQN